MLILSILRYPKGCYTALFNQREISSVLTFLSFLMSHICFFKISTHQGSSLFKKKINRECLPRVPSVGLGLNGSLNTIPPKPVSSSSNFLFKAYIWWMSFHLLNGIKIESYQYYFPKPSHPLVWVIHWNLPVFFFFFFSLFFSHTFHYTYTQNNSLAGHGGMCL